MKCPECGTTAPSGSRFCPSCGARIDREVPAATPPPPTQPQHPVHAATQARASTGGGAQLLAIIGGLGASAGCLLPWFTGGGYIERGMDLTEGVIVLVLGLIIAAFTIYSMVSRARWPGYVAMLAAVGSVILVIRLVIDIFQAAADFSVSPLEFVGWGFAITLVGSLLAAGGASRSLRSR